MERTAAQLREDALAIWRAGLAAVDSSRLMTEHVVVQGDELLIGDEVLSLSDYRQIVVVGAGKAGAGMAQGLEVAIGSQVMAAKKMQGWVNVPEDCVRPLHRIHLHGARPAGRNEPTEAGVFGSNQILQLLRSASPNDLCICLISGGGSALLPAPRPGISLADKQTITRLLSGAGANIQELNAVRKPLSLLKGGGLAQACRAGRLVTLIISDVLGDPLDVIASGPTVPEPASPRTALAVLDKFFGADPAVPASVRRVLESLGEPDPSQYRSNCEVTNLVIGNNATAVDAAGIEAERRGYSHAMTAATTLEGPAEEVGWHHASLAVRMRDQPGPDCLISGGEPTVKLAPPDRRGKGGRNQQLILAALDWLRNHAAQPGGNPLTGLAMLSGGTDGEDGPTDAAGAMLDEAIYEAFSAAGLSVEDALTRNDGYPFWDACGGLIKTGPTHTNVCDLRVIVTSQRSQ